MQGERVVGGIACSTVLARLEDFASGTLPDAEVAEVRAHLAGCDVCLRFGGRYLALVARLKASFAEVGDAGDGEV